MLSLSFTASLSPSVSLSVFIGNFLQEARTLPHHFFRFDLNKQNYVKFGNPEMCFSFWQNIFSFARRRKLHLWAAKILQNFVSLKRKRKKELVWRGFEPLAVEVVNKQLKESDGGREAVDARERALHREATVALDKFRANFK